MARVAIVDSANGHVIEATVSLEARGTPIRGAFIVILTGSDIILGRISKVVMTNPIHENPTFAPVIMKQGSIPFWSGDVDIEKATIEIISVMDRDKMQRVPLRSNPPSGTDIYLADRQTMAQFAIEKQHFLALGHVPNSGGLFCSVVNRHYGPMSDESGDLGGYGEARHIAILGQSGSAKTVLLTMLIAGRLAAHPQMGLLMPDTSGDLADATRHSRGSFHWNYDDVLKAAGVTIERVPIANIRLTSTSTLIKKLQPVLMHRINMAADNARRLADAIVNDLFGMGDVDASRITTRDILHLAGQHIAGCYSAPAQKKDKTQEVVDISQNANRLAVFDRDLAIVRNLFDGRVDVRDLVRGVLSNGKKIIIEMSSISESEHRFVMYELMSRLKREAEKIFHDGNTANANIVLDESQRWLPEGDDDPEGLSELIKDGFRSTRKLGVGWTLVAQSPAGVSKKALRECHTWYCGRNLGLGIDQAHLKEKLGEDGIEAYRQLAIQGGYFWVAAGLDNNLSTGTDYFTFHPFGGDATKAFIQANPHIFGQPAVAAAAE
jgi:hypothetical protein